MPSNSSVAGFGIFDLLTRVTPGAFFLLTVFGGDLLANGSLPERHMTIYLIGFGIVALIIGEALNYLRSVVYGVPNSFRRFLFEQRGENIRLGWLDKLRQKAPLLSVGNSKVYTQTKDDFWEEFTYQFDLSDDFDSVPDIYRIFLSYIEPKLSYRVQRQQTVFHFFNNMSLSIVFTVLVLLMQFFQAIFSGETTGIDVAWPMVATVLSLMLIYTLAAVFGTLESEYVNNLIVEYYIDRALAKSEPKQNDTKGNEISKKNNDLQTATTKER